MLDMPVRKDDETAARASTQRNYAELFQQVYALSLRAVEELIAREPLLRDHYRMCRGPPADFVARHGCARTVTAPCSTK